jgi:hypothetical protein
MSYIHHIYTQASKLQKFAQLNNDYIFSNFNNLINNLYNIDNIDYIVKNTVTISVDEFYKLLVIKSQTENLHENKYFIDHINALEYYKAILKSNNNKLIFEAYIILFNACTYFIRYITPVKHWNLYAIEL